MAYAPPTHTHNTRAYNSILLERPLTTGEMRANVIKQLRSFLCSACSPIRCTDGSPALRPPIGTARRGAARYTASELGPDSLGGPGAVDEASGGVE